MKSHFCCCNPAPSSQTDEMTLSQRKSIRKSLHLIPSTFLKSSPPTPFLVPQHSAISNKTNLGRYNQIKFPILMLKPGVPCPPNSVPSFWHPLQSLSFYYNNYNLNHNSTCSTYSEGNIYNLKSVPFGDHASRLVTMCPVW